MKTFISVTNPDLRSLLFPREVIDQLEAFSEVVWPEAGSKLTSTDLANIIHEYDACITSWGSPRFTAEVLAKAKKLKVIGHAAGSVASIVDADVFETGISVTCANKMLVMSTAEAAVALMLAGAWDLHGYNARLKQGVWSVNNRETVLGLQGRTIGLIGFGEISSHVAQLLKSFKPKLLLYSRYCTPEEAEALGVELCSLDELLTRSDIVSLHNTWTPSTEGMIGKRELSLMRDGTLFVNTARGAIVDEDALTEELASGRISAALDVYRNEPLDKEHPLLKLENVFCLPHIGGFHETYKSALAKFVISDLERAVRGDALAGQITAERYERLTPRQNGGHGMLQLEEAKQFILERTRRNAVSFGDRLPTSTAGGKYQFQDNGFWVGGFWTGLQYLCYEWTKDEAFVASARASQHRLVKRLYEDTQTLDHDIGFLYGLSSVADYKTTGNEQARKIALDAAEQLANRYNEKGRLIQAWNVWKPGETFSEQNRGGIIIDCMYNLPILFWAAEETGNEKYRNIADSFAEVCARTIIRPDATAFHTFVFDHETGKPLFGQTHQGYADDSVWARGQTWAMGGYAHAYRYTGNPEFLELSKRLSDVFLNALESDLVPMWDLALPQKEGQPRDSSAAAIAAAGLLELASHLEGEEKKRYADAAVAILDSLYRNYSTKDMPEEEGLLVHACGNAPKNQDMDCSLIYGDYYFAEAIGRLSGSSGVYW